MELFGWSFTYSDDKRITISQPALVHATLTNARMKHCNGPLMPYNHMESLHPSEPNDTHCFDTIEHYPQLVGDLRYLADCQRPDLEYAKDKIGCATQSPTTRQWRAMKAALRYLIKRLKKALHSQPTQPDSPVWHYHKDMRTKASGSGPH